MLRILNEYNFKTYKQVANNKEEHRNIQTTNKECFQYLRLSECFPFKNCEWFFFIYTVVFYYDTIDSGRSIKLHSRTDLLKYKK